MTHGHFQIFETTGEGNRNQYDLYTHHDGHLESLLEDIYCLADKLVVAAFAPFHWLYANNPTLEEVRARLGSELWDAFYCRNTPHNAGTWLIFPRKGQLDRLMTPGRIEAECESFNFFNYPSAQGVGAAISSLHWNRWYPANAYDISYSGPFLELEVRELENAQNGSRLNTLLMPRIPLKKSNVSKEEAEEISECAAAYAHMAGVITLEGEKLPSVSFHDQWKAAMRREMARILPLVKPYERD